MRTGAVLISFVVLLTVLLFAAGEKSETDTLVVSEIVESYNEAKQTRIGLFLWWSVFGVLLIGIFAIGFLIVKQIRGIKDSRDQYESVKNSGTFLKTGP